MRERFSFSQKYSNQPGIYSVGTAGFSPKLKWLKQDNEEKVKNECNCTAAFRYSLKAYTKTNVNL
jgi:hypothetical protein